MTARPYLGINVNTASVEELHYRGLIEEGETLLALFDGVLLDEHRRRIGGVALSDFVALTDRRVIIWARGFFNDTVDGFEWKDVDVVRSETWDPWHGRVVLAFRLPPVAPRKRRIAVNGSTEDPGTGERLLINTLDYMPTDDVKIFSQMVGLIGDQIIAGMSSEELIAAFVAEFPQVERAPLQPFFTPPTPVPPQVEPLQTHQEQPRRRRWWQFGAADENTPTLTPPSSPADLITAYEHQRVGTPAGSGAPPMVPSAPGGMFPNLPEQPSMYEVSRSLRLVLEAPRKLARGLRRATEAVGGAGEMVNGLQDPRVRRNAMRGLYQVATQQEVEGGPLASVGPVVRAAVRFAEPLEDEQSAQQQSKRIQVRAAVRRTSTRVEMEEHEQPPLPRAGLSASMPDVAPPRPEPLRRSVAVRRVEPPTEPAVELSPEPAELPRVAPVRRIAVGRTERPQVDSEPVGAPRVVSYNGNGLHRPDDQA